MMTPFFFFFSFRTLDPFDLFDLCPYPLIALEVCPWFEARASKRFEADWSAGRSGACWQLLGMKGERPGARLSLRRQGFRNPWPARYRTARREIVLVP